MLRTILVLLFLIPYLILSYPFRLVLRIISKFNKEAADYGALRNVQWAFRVIAFLSGVKLTVLGREHIPTDRAVLYVGNHRSFFDIVLSYPCCPRLTGYIAKPSVMKVPSLGAWMELLYCLSIDRENTREALKTILSAIDLIKKGVSVAIYPEGTRNRHPKEGLLPFKEGSLKIAEKAGCPIVPMAIYNSENVLEAHFPRIRSVPVILEYGEPIYPNELSKEEKKHLGTRTQQIIQEMLEKNAGLADNS